MKLKLLTLIVFLFCNLTAISQKQWLNPRPTGYGNSQMFFTDRSRGLIFNNYGDLVVTEDQGLHWQVQKHFPNGGYLVVKDSMIIVTSDNGRLHISHDLGKTWDLKVAAINGYIPFTEIISKDTLVVGTGSTLAYSSNGGNSWRYVNYTLRFTAINFVNSKVGYAGAEHNIYKTVDGGATWQEILHVVYTPSEIHAIKFLDTQNGFASRGHGDILSTNDGGVSWKTNTVLQHITSFNFVSTSVGFATDDRGMFYRTDNGGQSWAVPGQPGLNTESLSFPVYFLDSDTGFVAGGLGFISKTTDGGKTWAAYSPFYADIQDIAAPSSLQAYAITPEKIFKTNDKGQTWTPLDLAPGFPGSSGVFQRAHFFNKDTGIVTSNNQAKLFKTYDGGQQWKQISFGLGYSDVRTLQFFNNDIGYVLLKSSNQGTVMRTTDGGESWIYLPIQPGMGSLSQVHFADVKTGYASMSGELFKTQDSAATWQSLWKENDKEILSIWCKDAATIFVSGTKGLFRKSTDSGKTWVNVTVSGARDAEISRLQFFDQQVGYFTVGNYSIFKTVNGGLQWQEVSDRVPAAITSINFSADTAVYFGGIGGAILKDNVQELTIYPIQVSNEPDCKTNFYTDVYVALTEIDSIRFEYGAGDFSNVVAGSPSSVAGTNRRVQAVVSETLRPSTLHQVRLNYFRNGVQHFTKEVFFYTPAGPAKPGIQSSGSTSFCQGDSILLQSSAQTGIQWYLNGTALVNENKPSLFAKSAGVYQLTQTVGCYSSDTAALDLMVIAAPAKPQIYVNGNVLTSSSASGNQWYLNGVAIAGANGSVYSAIDKGTYTVNVKQGNCHSEYSDPIHFDSATDIVSTFPNPVIDDLIVKNNAGERMSIQIVDGLGNTVYSIENGPDVQTIDMSRFAKGKYFVRVLLLGSNTTHVKIVIKM